MKDFYDVLVIGAGTAGSFFAKRMANLGLSVLVADRVPQSELGKRLDIFHIDKDFFAKFGVPEPKPGDEDYVSLFEYGFSRSAFDRYEKRTDYPFLVMSFPLFLKRLVKWGTDAGVEYAFDTEFEEFILINGKIRGAKLKFGGKTREVRASLVADCSGIRSDVRRALPEGYGVETFPIGDKDKFYVVLRYVLLKNPEKDRVTRSVGYPYYKTWIAPQHDPDGAIIGVGANISFDYAEECFAKFEKSVALPPYELQRIERGTTPYRRPPYSLVGDGFVVLGDSACITKPFSGEGITASWVLCDIAAEVIGKVIKAGLYPEKRLIWQTNVRYFRGQGAAFANLLATLTGAVNSTAEENDYEFENDIVFESKAMTEMNRKFAAEMSLKDTATLIAKVTKGLIFGKIKLKTVGALIKSVLSAGALQKHYRNYPESERGFAEWAQKSDKLWKKAGNMADNIIKSKG